MIVGIDEVGRGCWAGPLVVGAVALGGAEIPGLTDSKKLTSQRREQLARQIRYHAPAIGVGWVSNRAIDARGLGWALKQAARLALAHITIEYDEIIIDGTIRLVDDSRVITMKKADLLVPSVSAASIIAKVARDRYMQRMHAVFPDYGFHRHVGYGTAGHQAAIKEYGVTPLHRLSFAPLTGMKPPEEATEQPVAATTGRQAECLAAQFLEAKGFTIVARNWRTKWCEIDIIAEKAGVFHFVEVKYRKTDFAGDGLAAVTAQKQQQMRFAAELWRRDRPQAAGLLSVISLSGEPMTVSAWVADIS